MEMLMRKQPQNYLRQNIALARKQIGSLGKQNCQALTSLSQDHGFSIALGDLLLLDGKWYVTHTGLIRLANRARCSGIRVQPMREFCDASVSRWVFRATVYKSPGSRGFVGYGDADPSNVSSLVHGAEMRVAQTRPTFQQNLSEPHLENRIILAQVDSTFDLAHGLRLLPRFTVGNCAVSLLASFRIARSRRNSICRLSERCSCCASSTIFALRLAGMRIRSRAFGSADGLGMAPTTEVIY
jgi:hypothetical protein